MKKVIGVVVVLSLGAIVGLILARLAGPSSVTKPASERQSDVAGKPISDAPSDEQSVPEEYNGIRLEQASAESTTSAGDTDLGSSDWSPPAVGAAALEEVFNVSFSPEDHLDTFFLQCLSEFAANARIPTKNTLTMKFKSLSDSQLEPGKTEVDSGWVINSLFYGSYWRNAEDVGEAWADLLSDACSSSNDVFQTPAIRKLSPEVLGDIEETVVGWVIEVAEVTQSIDDEFRISADCTCTDPSHDGESGSE